MQIPFIAAEQEGNFPINLYFHPQGFNGRPALLGTPGLVEFCDTENATSEVRCLHEFGDYTYAIVGNKGYRINSAGEATLMTNTLGTTTGIVYASNDGTNVLFTDGAEGYTTTTTTLTAIADADFPTPSSNTFQDGYFAVTESATGKFFISALNDPTSWDALDFTTAEGNPDIASRIIMDHRELFVFGPKSIEPYYNSGDSTHQKITQGREGFH